MKDDWRDVELGDVAVVSWGDTSVTKASYVQEGFPAYSASGPDGYLPYADHRQAGVVISAIGAECGKTWLAKGNWSCIKNTLWFRSRSPDADTTFLFYATSSPSAWPRRGAAQPFISLGDAKRVRLLLPPMTIQQKVAATLSAYDDLIENNTRRIAILEEIARRVYEEWFVNFRFPGHDNVVRLVDSELGPIPAGWTIKPASEVVEEVRDHASPASLRGSSVNYYSFAAYDEGQVPAVVEGSTIQSGKFMLRGRAVLLAKLNPRIPRVWLSDPVNAHPPVTSTEFLVLWPRPPWTLPFLYSTCMSEPFHDRFVRLSVGTSTSHQRVKPHDFRSLPVLDPPQGLLRQFTWIVAPMHEAVRFLRRTNHVLLASRDLVLPKLISGAIDVSNLEIDTGEDVA